MIFSGPDMQGDFYSYPPDLNCLPDSRTDGNLINSISEMSELCRESELSYPNVSVKEISHGIDGNNSVPADCLMNIDVTSTGCCDSEVHMNFMPMRCTTGYPIKAHGAEAKNSRMSRFHMKGKFSSSECSTPLLPLVDNFGETRNKHDINTIMPSLSSPQKVDRNFLTLGIGSCTEIRPNSNFSTQEIAIKLDEDSSHYNYSTVRDYCSMNPLNLTQSMGRAGRIGTSADGPNNNCSAQETASTLEESTVGDCPMNPLDLSQSMGSAVRIRTSASGLSSSECSLASRMSAHDEGRPNGHTEFRLNSIPCSGLQTPQANAQYNVSQRYFSSVFDSTQLSLPFGSTLISQPKYGTQPELNTSAYLASQPISPLQYYCRENFMKVSSESSRKWLSQWHNQSSISHEQLGSLIPLTEASQSNADVHFPGSVLPERIPTSTAEDSRTTAAKIGSFASNIHPVGLLNTHNFGPVEALENNLFPHRNGFQISKSGTIQSATAGPFPKRLGLQPNDVATARTTRGQAIPVAKSDVSPQSSPIASHPYLKRKATENLASACLGQQRKIVPQPVMHHSRPQRQSIQDTKTPIPATVHIPPAPLHIKWQGCNEPLEPTGEKCLLCKRDLSFTAEGLVFQPAAPPPVAVLPCGHTFHDHCLQIITPEDQLNVPPCIPCAIGEA